MNFKPFSALAAAAALAAPVGALAAQQAGAELFRLARFNQAAAAYPQEIRQHPRDLQLRLDLVRTYLRLDGSRWGDAIREARQAIAVAPASAEAHGLLGLALMRGGQPEAAAVEADRALALDKNSYFGLIAMGRVDLWNQDRLGARALLLRAVQEAPARATAYPYLLDTFREGERDKALAYAKAYVKLDPKGHPHDRIIDGWRTEQGKLLTGAAGVDYAAGTPFTAEQAKEADAGAIPPVTYTTSIDRHGDDIILPVTMDGQQYHLLFDTGAGRDVVLSSSSAAQLQATAIGRELARGVSGKQTNSVYLINKMQVGPQAFGPVRVAGLDSGGIGSADGLVGGAFFDNSAVTVDFRYNTITFARGKLAAAPAADPGDQLLKVPFHFLHGYIFVPVRLADNPAVQWALLDTGAEGMGVLSLQTARQLAKSQQSDSIKELHVDRRVGIGTNQTAFQVLLFRFSVDLTLCGSGPPYFLEMQPIFGASMVDDQVSRDFDFQICGIVGISYLAQAKRVTFDYPHRLLTVELPG